MHRRIRPRDDGRVVHRPNAPAPLGPYAATIKFPAFAQTFEGTMHNEVDLGDLVQGVDAHENNNIATLDTSVVDKGSSAGATSTQTERNRVAISSICQ